MKKIIVLISLFLACSFQAWAQYPPSGGRPGGKFDPSKMNIGRLYGKVVGEDGKGIGFASVQVHGKKFDRASRSLKDTLLSGQLTRSNGDFDIQSLPVVGEFKLVISYLGYAKLEKMVDFGLKMPPGGMRPGKKDSTGNAEKPTRPKMGKPNFDQDLGNIQLTAEALNMEEVEITAENPVVKMALDRKIFRVDKDLTTAGGTAEDALRNVPSLSVDLDGNVSLRNGSPQIFVDGRPSTLSLDQIPADAIENVEVITNPSAKYDAGGGAAGIINIVMKKERRIGYNGNIRFGGDSQLGSNLGGNVNARGEKVNVFASANLFNRRGNGQSETFRQNLFGDPLNNITQLTETEFQGNFVRGRAGVDFFLDNRNTLTLSGSAVRGRFNNFDELTTTTDFLYESGTETSSYVRTTIPDRGFRNVGATAQFKHLFPKDGAEWTADFNYNQVLFEGNSEFKTVFDSGEETREKQEILGTGSFMTAQTDLIYPLGNGIKVEAGLKSIIRTNTNRNASFVYDNVEKEFVEFTQLANDFEFDDRVFAAYIQGSRSNEKWGIQGGLRAESSFYEGRLPQIDSSFNINYPINLFPSIFLTRKFKGGNELQLALTRRVNRPNFFQTSPFVDFSDSLNLRRGNPALLPEFTNSAELSYQKVIGKNHMLLASVYYKQATNVITTFQNNEFNETLGKEVVVISYINGDQAYAYGAELTLRNSFFGWLDLTSNVNFYQAAVNASNLQDGLQTSLLSGFFKETMQIRLPKGFSLQFNGEYRTRAAFTPSNGNRQFGPGGGAQNSAQGYSLAYWVVNASARKDLFNRKASITFSLQDVFASRRMGAYTETDFFIQESSRINNPQLVRLNFSYRFGKMDASLFKRKNNRINSQGSDMMM